MVIRAFADYTVKVTLLHESCCCVCAEEGRQIARSDDEMRTLLPGRQI